MTLAIYSAAFLLDLILGDPHHWPHPIRWIGNSISWVQQKIRAICHSEPVLYVGGAVLWLAYTILARWKRVVGNSHTSSGATLRSSTKPRSPVVWLKLWLKIQWMV